MVLWLCQIRRMDFVVLRQIDEPRKNLYRTDPQKVFIRAVPALQHKIQNEEESPCCFKF